LFNNPFLDHFFGVMGFIPSGKEHNQNYWMNAVVCDPWKEECYTITRENIQKQRMERTAMLDEDSSHSRLVYSILSPSSKEDVTIAVAGEIKQNIIVPRSILSFDENEGVYKCQPMNLLVPMVYTKEIDYGNEVVERHKRTVNKRIIGLFSEKSGSDKKSQAAKNVAKIVSSYLYSDLRRKR
jgi:hypothetical protein